MQQLLFGPLGVRLLALAMPNMLNTVPRCIVKKISCSIFQKSLDYAGPYLGIEFPRMWAETSFVRVLPLLVGRHSLRVR